jgi:hypothetical protein
MNTFLDFLTEGVLTPHKELRTAGWKKTGQSGESHVYTHPHHTGHEIHLHPAGNFEHKVTFGKEHVQKGKYGKSMSPLTKHLDAHSRHTDYDEHTRAAAHRKAGGGAWDDHGDHSPNPRGPQG